MTIDVLWTTDPGWVAIGLLLFSIILTVMSWKMKFQTIPLVITIVAWIVTILAVLGVTGAVTLPGFLDYFNIAETATP